ncbi:hypothetical protein D3C84_1263380 [compost metagenome]
MERAHPCKTRRGFIGCDIRRVGNEKLVAERPVSRGINVLTNFELVGFGGISPKLAELVFRRADDVIEHVLVQAFACQ